MFSRICDHFRAIKMQNLTDFKFYFLLLVIKIFIYYERIVFYIIRLCHIFFV